MRKLSDIAAEINRDWTRPSVYARPYLSAMAELESMEDHFFCDSAYEIVARFLSNAGAWRGETARAVKLELNLMLRERSQ
jgi:hypothetical protein